MPDGSIALYGSNLQLNLTSTPFVSKNVLSSLNATTFQITDSSNKTVTFEFIDQSLTTQTTPTAGDVAIDFNS